VAELSRNWSLTGQLSQPRCGMSHDIHGDKQNWRGPYSNEMSVTLMIARTIRAGKTARK